MEKCSLVSFPVVSFVDFLVFFSLFETIQPCVEAVQQDRGLFAYPPGIELREADGGIDVYLRNAVGCGTGNAFVAYGIVDVSMGYQGNQLFGTVLLYFLNAGMGSANSFLVPHYPINPRLFKIGVSWNFYD